MHELTLRSLDNGPARVHFNVLLNSLADGVTCTARTNNPIKNSSRATTSASPLRPSNSGFTCVQPRADVFTNILTDNHLCSDKHPIGVRILTSTISCSFGESPRHQGGGLPLRTGHSPPGGAGSTLVGCTLWNAGAVGLLVGSTLLMQCATHMSVDEVRTGIRSANTCHTSKNPGALRGT